MVNRTHRIATKLHKWIALVAGVQLMLWTVSGLFMTIWPIETVRGEHLMAKAEAPVLDRPFVMPDFDGEPVTDVALRNIGARAVLVVTHPTRRMMHDPYTGAAIPPPDAERIAALAGIAVADAAAIEEVSLIEADPPSEWRGALPVWQVRFAGPERLRLYMDAVTGEVLTRRTRLWRVYDFMWMLHIMDYDEREDFNNPLVQLAAGLGLSVAISGLVLTFYRVLRRRRGPRASIAAI
ncbi:MAG: PepSY domain-containing protein [Pseudomonadota bacterium]